MKNWKKLFATVLAVCMVVGLLPISAFAAVGNIIVAPIYAYYDVYAFDADNTAEVLTNDWENVRVKATDAGLEGLGYVTDDSANDLVGWWDEDTGLYGYKDPTGESWVIPAQFDDINTWSFGPGELAAVYKDGKCGLIDYYGNVKLNFQYDSIYPCYPEELKGFFIFDVYGGDGNGFEGLLDSTGKVVLPAVYDYLDTWELDTLADGTKVIWGAKPNGDRPSIGVAIDLATGREVMTLPEGLYRYGNFNGSNLCVVEDTSNEGKYGYLDANGNLAIPAIFDDANEFVGGLALVGKRVSPDSWEVKYAVMNTSAILLTDYIYDYSYPYSKEGMDTGCIVVRNMDGMYGVVNSQGVEVIPCTYDYIDTFVNGMAKAYKDTGEAGYYRCGVIDLQGNVVVPFEYSDVVLSAKSPYFWVNTFDEETYDSYYGLGKMDYNAVAAPAPAPAAKVAVASTLTVDLGGTPVTFEMYALKDSVGNLTNYVKVRDVAAAMDGTASQFNVGWDGGVNLITGAAYTDRNGKENNTPYAGDQPYETYAGATKVNGQDTAFDAFTIKDADGNGYTYYQLRDLGKALGFNVRWDNDARMIVVEPGVAYTG